MVSKAVDHDAEEVLLEEVLQSVECVLWEGEAMSVDDLERRVKWLESQHVAQNIIIAILWFWFLWNTVKPG